jgi:hypothetical protein
MRKFLRRQWAAGRPVVEFALVSGEFGGQIVESPGQWRRVPATVFADRKSEYEYDLGGAFPVDRIALDLGEANSVVPPPFLLAYGSRAVPPEALPFATLVPDYEVAKGLPPDILAAQPGAQMPAGGPDRLRASFDTGRWWLWTNLALGALTLGWMAWRRSREIGSKARPDTESDTD